jgi:hypothetical protein
MLIASHEADVFSLTRVVIACNQHGLPRLEKNLNGRFFSGGSSGSEC